MSRPSPVPPSVQRRAATRCAPHRTCLRRKLIQRREREQLPAPPIAQQVGRLPRRARVRLRQCPRSGARRGKVRRSCKSSCRVAPRQEEVHVTSRQNARRARQQDCLRRHRPLRRARGGTTCRASRGKTAGRAKLVPRIPFDEEDGVMLDVEQVAPSARCLSGNRVVRSRTPKSWELCAFSDEKIPAGEERRLAAPQRTAHEIRREDQPGSHKRGSRATGTARCAKIPANSWKSRGKKERGRAL